MWKLDNSYESNLQKEEVLASGESAGEESEVDKIAERYEDALEKKLAKETGTSLLAAVLQRYSGQK